MPKLTLSLEVDPGSPVLWEAENAFIGVLDASGSDVYLQIRRAVEEGVSELRFDKVLEGRKLETIQLTISYTKHEESA